MTKIISLLASNIAGLPEVKADQDNLNNLFATIFGTIAAVAIIIIMIASINFATAGSDTEKIARSKNAIIYAVIGLVIALSAELIVLTVLGKL